jgi:hypothetical protein
VIVDPWAVSRATFVAIERDRVAAAAHLVRYGDDARVSASYRDVAEIRWLVFLPGDRGDVGEQYGRSFEKPLVATVSQR